MRLLGWRPSGCAWCRDHLLRSGCPPARCSPACSRSGFNTYNQEKSATSRDACGPTYLSRTPVTSSAARNVSGRCQTVIVNSPYRVADSPRPDAGHSCSCCLRPWSECFVDVTRSNDRPRQRTCPPCHEHGPSGLEASRVHAELWRDLARSRQRERDAREAQLRNRIAQLEQELRDRPTQTVERWLTSTSLKRLVKKPTAPSARATTHGRRYA